MNKRPTTTESSPSVSPPAGREIKGDGFLSITGRISVLLAIVLSLVSCRGQQFEQQPIHPNLNMDQQERFEAQESNPFFDDNRSMRQPVEGTIARGNLRQDPVYYQGINEDSSFVTEIPVEITRSFLYRGKERYEIYCTPCHGITGDGQGIIMTGGYGFVPAPTFHQDRIRDVENGYLYSVIANGIRTMPSYAHQVDVEDRWAIVAYVRALQRSQNVSVEDIQAYDVDLEGMEEAFAQQQAAQEEMEAAAAAASASNVSAARGEELYVANGCQACHSRDGASGIGPTHLNIFGRTEELTDGSTVTVDDEYLYESITEPNTQIVAGFNPVMVPYNFLSEDEILSIIEYLKTLSDNQ